MSFGLHFINNDVSYDINFIEKTISSNNTISINYKNYELQGDASKIAWLKANILNLANFHDMSLQDLQGKLQNIGAKDITTTKVYSIGVEHLSPSSGILTETITLVRPGKSTAMDRIMQFWVNERGFSGTVLVFDKNQPILKKGYGSAKIDDAQVMPTGTKFPIGSVTKPVTSCALLKLTSVRFLFSTYLAA